MPVRLLRLPLLAILLAGPGGCGYGLFHFPPQARGSQVDPDDLAQLVPGISTQRDVSALLGTPTSKASFDNNTWLYVAQITQPVIAGTLAVRSQHVFVVTFDPKGVLTNVAIKNKADALPVQVVSRTTPSPGTEASFMQQLIGNIGRFNPAGQPISSAPGGGGANGQGGL